MDVSISSSANSGHQSRPTPPEIPAAVWRTIPKLGALFPFHLFTVDSDARIVWSSLAMQDSLFDAVHTDDLPFARKHWGRTLKEEAHLEVRLRMRLGNSTTHQLFRVLVLPVEDDASGVVARHWLVCCAPSNQSGPTVESSEEFLSICAHEFKTPITIIRTYLELMQRSLTMGTKIDGAAIDRCLSAAGRLTRILDDVADFSRLRSGLFRVRTRRADLVIVCRESTLGALAKYPPKTNIRLISNLPPSMTASIDPDRMRQVIDNLLHNACKYSPAGGSVELSLSEEDSQACIRVRDEGLGIPAEDIPHLCEPFYRSSATHQLKGLGIGLFVVSCIVQEHHGTLKIESTLGKGSTFEVRIPLTA